jgi:hypothetical protein
VPRHPDQSTLLKWADGELSVDEVADIVRHVDECPGCNVAAQEIERAQRARFREGGSQSAPFPDVPTTIGPYTVLERIGKGGMGEVYLAEQRVPMRRRVAVKLIKTDETSSDAAVRFRLEGQALALMSHPNIATIYEAGTDADRPYLAMENGWRSFWLSVMRFNMRIRKGSCIGI